MLILTNSTVINRKYFEVHFIIFVGQKISYCVYVNAILSKVMLKNGHAKILVHQRKFQLFSEGRNEFIYKNDLLYYHRNLKKKYGVSNYCCSFSLNTSVFNVRLKCLFSMWHWIEQGHVILIVALVSSVTTTKLQ